MNWPIRLVLWGVGALGHLVAEAAAHDHRFAVVGAIDHAPDKVGRDLADLAHGVRPGQVIVTPDLNTCLESLSNPPDVLLHMTESSIPRIIPQLQAALNQRLNVISAAESMFYPALRYPDVAAFLDQMAKTKGVTITGAGVNPGFVFDTLVLALAIASTEISSVRLNRVVEVAGTGPCDIAHTGFGLWPDEFWAKLQAGEVVGHMGLAESVVVIAERLGLLVDRFQEQWTVVTSDQPTPSTIGLLEPGRVTGIIQIGTAYQGTEAMISTRLAMYYGATQHEPEIDEITIHGRHTIHLQLRPAAVSILSAALLLLNTAPAVVAAPPGLITVVDLPVAATPRGTLRLCLDTTYPLEVGTLRFSKRPLRS